MFKDKKGRKQRRYNKVDNDKMALTKSNSQQNTKHTEQDVTDI